MKILICPDSFKGSGTSKEVGQAMKRATKEIFPSAAITTLAMADGGEGTVEAIAQNGIVTHHTAVVTAPYGDKVEVTYPITEEGVAILEMASASGLPLSPRRVPMLASSIGTGQLIVHAINAGASRIILGIGGSATNDGGMGLLAGLGGIFTDALGNVLSPIGGNMSAVHKIDLSGIPLRVSSTPIGVICDVSNPLLGEKGATAVYGPQKGVTEDTAEHLEEGMAHFAQKLVEATGKDHRLTPGAGAAGGVGFALASLPTTKLSPGINLVLQTIGFDQYVKNATLIITGEGRIDRQSVDYGKVVSGIIDHAKGLPVLVVSGGIGEGGEEILNRGNCSIVTSVNAPMTLEEAIVNSEELIYSATKRGLALIRMGLLMGNRG